jgi:protoporphyrinogen oxidase
MPLQESVLNVEPPLAEPVQEAARRLLYRDFLLVALIVNRDNVFPDQWIYVHDPAVKVGRIGNYNNWTHEMAANREATCLEMEYFCSQGDSFWRQTDADLLAFAKSYRATAISTNPVNTRSGNRARLSRNHVVGS